MLSFLHFSRCLALPYLLSTFAFAAEKIPIPGACSNQQIVEADNQLSFLRIQLSALAMNHQSAAEIQTTVRLSSDPAFTLLSGIKRAVKNLECSAYLMNQFEESPDEDIAKAAALLRYLYLEFSKRETHFIRRLVDEDLFAKPLQRADATSTLATQVDELGVDLTNGLALTLMKLIDCEKLGGPCNRLIFSKTERESLQRLMQTLFPQMGRKEAIRSGEDDIFVKTAYLVQTILEKRFKASDEH